MHVLILIGKYFCTPWSTNYNNMGSNRLAVLFLLLIQKCRILFNEIYGNVDTCPWIVFRILWDCKYHFVIRSSILIGGSNILGSGDPRAETLKYIQNPASHQDWLAQEDFFLLPLSGKAQEVVEGPNDGRRGAPVSTTNFTISR
jgi:hypothetical protein